jgi:hypothetical protein
MKSLPFCSDVVTREVNKERKSLKRGKKKLFLLSIFFFIGKKFT